MARRKKSILKTIRNRLRSGEKVAGGLFKQEAVILREAINTPRARERFEFKKPLLDDPSQLKKKRFRPSVRVFGPMAIEINIRRKKRKTTS